MSYYERACVALEKQDFVHLNSRNIIVYTLSAYVKAGRFAKAAAWQRKWLAAMKKKHGANSLEYSAELATLGEILVRGGSYAEAEPVLREVVEIRKGFLAKKQLPPWRVAMANCTLGAALLGQKKIAEAEPLLEAGYRELKENEKAIPWNTRDAGMSLAIQGLVDLAKAKNKPDDVKKWQAELAGRVLANPPAKKN